MVPSTHLTLTSKISDSRGRIYDAKASIRSNKNGHLSVHLVQQVGYSTNFAVRYFLLQLKHWFALKTGFEQVLPPNEDDEENDDAFTGLGGTEVRATKRTRSCMNLIFTANLNPFVKFYLQLFS